MNLIAFLALAVFLVLFLAIILYLMWMAGWHPYRNGKKLLREMNNV